MPCYIEARSLPTRLAGRGRPPDFFCRHAQPCTAPPPQKKTDLGHTLVFVFQLLAAGGLMVLVQHVSFVMVGHHSFACLRTTKKILGQLHASSISFAPTKSSEAGDGQQQRGLTLPQLKEMAAQKTM